MSLLISVIIPNYNHVGYLKQRLDCVLSQSYQQIELIILDDCSTDESKSVIENYRFHPKVAHIVYNESNSGSTFFQWKKGIELSGGEYVWIAESDDATDPLFLEKCLNLFGKHKDIGVVYTQSLSINEHGKTESSWLKHTSHMNETLWLSDFTMNGNEFATRYMLFQNSIPNASAVVFRKEVYETAGGVNTKFRINGDWDLYTRMLSYSDVGFISDPLNYFRQHSNKGSSGNIIKGYNIVEYYWLLKGWTQLFSLSASEKAHLAGHIFHIWKNQYNANLRQMMRTNFKNIIVAAVKVDSRVIIRLLRMAI